MMKMLPTSIENTHNFMFKVVLIQVAVPSREDVEEYRQLKSEVDELVGRINSKYGTHIRLMSFNTITYIILRRFGLSSRSVRVS